MDNLKKIPLPGGLTLIVEARTHYQPNLEAEAHLAGIWPEKDGP